MKECDYCQHVEMCRWREELEERGCDFFDDGNKWISVSERLPKYDVDVLVTDKEVSSMYVGQYCGNGFWWTDTGCEKGRIVAWMPLPEPYKVDPQESEEI